MNRPVIAITMGDAAGIGPEIIVKALQHERIYSFCRPLVIGDAVILERAVSVTNSGLTVRSVDTPQAARYVHGAIDCIDLKLLSPDLPFGEISAAAGNAAYRYIERAVDLAKRKEIDAIATAPLNKEALHLWRSPLSGAYGNIGDLDRYGRLFDDAFVSEAESDSPDYPCRPFESDRKDYA